MEGEITIIAKFTRKDQQPEGPVLPVCHVTQVEDLGDMLAVDKQTAFLIQVGEFLPNSAGTPHLARMTVGQARLLVEKQDSSVVLVTDEVKGHQHKILVTYDSTHSLFIITDVSPQPDENPQKAWVVGHGRDADVVSDSLKEEVLAQPFEKGIMSGEVPFESVLRMEFITDEYSYRCQVGDYGTKIWCRYSRA